MRIAQIAPLYESVPPETYGGTERVIAALCNQLVAAGHEVTLFSAGTSNTKALLEPVVSTPLRTRLTRAEMVEVAPHLHLDLLAAVYERAAEFDIIHSHVDIWTLPFARSSNTPTVVTMHGRLDTGAVQHTLPLYPTVPLVSISNDQRRPLAGVDLNWTGTVYNGLDLEAYHSAARERARGPREYLAFVGRIHPEKGPEVAIEIARRTGRRLKMAAKVDPMDVDYFNRRVSSKLGSSVDFLGEIGEDCKPSFYTNAAATVFPSDWPEPFGLVMIESLAAGTPVIALRRGSVPEILIDGVTGFICDDIDEMVEAAQHIDEIDPLECRRRAKIFSSPAMSERYVDVYENVIDYHLYGQVYELESA